MTKAFPTFLVIGTQKGGTTWLHRQLRKHPDIWMPRIKELHYFDRNPKYPSPSHLTTDSLVGRIFGFGPKQLPRTLKGVSKYVKVLFKGNKYDRKWVVKWYFKNYNDAWYCNLFEEGMGAKARGEVNPSYCIIDKEDVERMKAINPDLRIVLMIRNPIDRAWGAVKYKSFKADQPFDIQNMSKVIHELRSAPFVAHGKYLKMIHTFMEVFPADQLLFCFFDAIRYNPSALLKEIHQHLGVEHLPIPEAELNKKINASFDQEMPQEVFEMLHEMYDAEIHELQSLLGQYSLSWTEDTSVDVKEMRPVVQLTDLSK